jgi:Zn finger protein HypA/HybF involved in hydrogenase expression
MGSILRATCSCGYRSGELEAGAGKRLAGRQCMLPALCRTCRAVVTADRLAPAAACPQCGGPVQFYDDPSLQAPRQGGGGQAAYVFRWPLGEGRFAELPATRYFCPKCEQLAMTFTVIGCVD